MKSQKYQGVLCKSKIKNEVKDTIAVEAPLQININNKPFTVTMRLPDNDTELVLGLLHSEGILNANSYIPTIEFLEKNGITIAEVTIPENSLESGYLNSRSLLSVSSCGICGRTDIEDILQKKNPLNSLDVLSLNKLCSMFDVVHKKQPVFLSTGGTHAAGIFTLTGKLLSIQEDIGRHNAVDKAIGVLAFSKSLSKAKVLVVSGRISYEIVVKCFKAQIPFLAAVSSPSSLAIDFAKELGITLLAFCRDKKATCYSFPEKIEVD